MKYERAKRKAEDVRRIGINKMSNHKPDKKAAADFQRPAYQAVKLIQAQGKQLEHKTVAEYVADKYGIEEVSRHETKAPE